MTCRQAEEWCQPGPCYDSGHLGLLKTLPLDREVLAAVTLCPSFKLPMFTYHRNYLHSYTA
jgi:hypothetical protein